MTGLIRERGRGEMTGLNRGRSVDLGWVLEGWSGVTQGENREERKEDPGIPVVIDLEDRWFASRLAAALAAVSDGLRFTVAPPDAGDCGDRGVRISDPEGGAASDLLLLSAAPGQTVPEGVPASVTMDRYADRRITRDRILSFCALLEGDLRGKRFSGTCGDLRLVVFASPAGGVGTTSCLLGSAAMMERIYGKRCLCLSMTPHAGFGRYFRDIRKPSGRFLYHLRRGEAFPILPWISEEGMAPHFLFGSLGGSGGALTEDAAGALLNRVQALGRFDYLFLDLGTEWDHLGAALFQAADAGVLISDARSRPVSAWERGVLAEMAAGRAQVIRVHSRCDPERSDGDGQEEEEAQEGALVISEQPEAFITMGGYTRIDLRGHYGLEIAALAKRIAFVCGRTGSRTALQEDPTGDPDAKS